MKQLIAILTMSLFASVTVLAVPVDAHSNQRSVKVVVHGPLVDLNPEVDGAYDDAYGHVVYRSSKRGTKIRLIVLGADRLNDGAVAHLHNGTCADLGGHYQDVIGGAVDPVNEAWQYLRQNRHVVKGKSSNEWEVRSGQPVSIGFHNGGAPEACLDLTG